MPPAAEPGSLLEIAIDIAEAAGGVVRDGLKTARAGVWTKTSGTDMVTDIDRASEALIAALLAERRPDDALVGEEGTDRPGTTGVRWIVDPIDGTTNYLYGYPAFSVSVAVEVDGVVVAGAVHDVVHTETFTALLGAGAWRDGEPLTTNHPDALGYALVGTGFSYESARRAQQGAVVARVLPAVRDIRRAGSAALDVCWVAAGRLDAFYERGLQPWDWAAAALVAAEAGARVGIIDGDLHVAAPPALFDELAALLI
jgi:myo-inositol-1(or 4)-monophosphatase